jgi:hypothetical protein
MFLEERVRQRVEKIPQEFWADLESSLGKKIRFLVAGKKVLGVPCC